MKNTAHEEDLDAFRLTHVTAAIAISFGICALSSVLGSLLGMEQYNILIITVITLVVANVFSGAMAKDRRRV